MKYADTLKNNSGISAAGIKELLRHKYPPPQWAAFGIKHANGRGGEPNRLLGDAHMAIEGFSYNRV